jgi:hypothetical protein
MERLAILHNSFPLSVTLTRPSVFTGWGDFNGDLMPTIIIPVHGVMTMGPGYSQEWISLLGFNPLPKDTQWQEFYYNDLYKKPDDTFKGINAWFKQKIARYLIDGEEALLYQAVRPAAMKRLFNVISAVPQSTKVIILAHSLGSVLAYETLAYNKLAGENLTLLTFGSPLVNTIERLYLEVRERPCNVSYWQNWSGKTDPVGGASLHFSNFNPQNQYWYPGGHNEYGYLPALRENLLNLLK